MSELDTSIAKSDGPHDNQRSPSAAHQDSEDESPVAKEEPPNISRDIPDSSHDFTELRPPDVDTTPMPQSHDQIGVPNVEPLNIEEITFGNECKDTAFLSITRIF